MDIHLTMTNNLHYLYVMHILDSFSLAF